MRQQSRISVLRAERLAPHVGRRRHTRRPAARRVCFLFARVSALAAERRRRGVVCRGACRSAGCSLKFVPRILQVLDKIYNHDRDWVRYELDEIAASHSMQRKGSDEDEGGRVQAKISSNTRFLGAIGATITRILRTPHVRLALLVGCSLQFFQQLAGINTIMYYTGELRIANAARNARSFRLHPQN